jgi:hypothetical protein
MKIATITCHDVYNYGASLQAYALQHYLESIGHNCQIIDYKPDYLSNHYNLRSVANPRFDKPMLRQLYLMAKLPGRIGSLSRKRRFDRFTSDYLHLTTTRYASSDQIAANCPKADVYIAGSDQIWNTFFQNGRDKAFYLDFAKGKGRLVSYAASFATEKIFNDADDFVRSELKNFDAVSVRESSALTLLDALGRNDGALVCDPVFLLEKEQWEKLSDKAEPQNPKYGDYIFLYDCERSEKLKNIAVALKKMSGCKIVSVSPTKGRYADYDCEMSGPLEFLDLLARSRYVVANSFHALAFALIFQKPFFIANRSEGINTRMRDFLQLISLSNRLIDSFEQLTFTDIDYSKTGATLSLLIKKSKNFLEEQTLVLLL